MAYQNYSEICPIFNTDNNSGVEHEVVFPVQLSCTTTSYPMLTWNPGREVVLMEAFIVGQCSTGLTTSMSCTLQIGSDESICTAIGSLAFGTLEQSVFLGAVRVSGSVTSTALTSTDIVSVYAVSGASVGAIAAGNCVLLRYREK